MTPIKPPPRLLGYNGIASREQRAVEQTTENRKQRTEKACSGAAWHPATRSTPLPFHPDNYPVTAMFKPPLTTHSPTLQRLLNSARMIAPSDAPLLIQGEAGSGRKTLALDLHYHSRRRNQGFTLYTGPTTQPDPQGSLYLPDLHTLTAEEQIALRRYLDQLPPTPRLLASTSVDLAAWAQSGRFSIDLYYRLAVVPLELPPLRQRLEDLVPLLKELSASLAATHRQRPPSYPPAVRNRLKQHPWPGNLRELTALCERMVLLHPGTRIEVAMLPPAFHPETQPNTEHNFLLPSSGIDLLQVESDLIRQAINMARGNRSRAARLLGISRDTLLYRIRKHGI